MLTAPAARRQAKLSITRSLYADLSTDALCDLHDDAVNGDAWEMAARLRGIIATRPDYRPVAPSPMVDSDQSAPF